MQNRREVGQRTLHDCLDLTDRVLLGNQLVRGDAQKNVGVMFPVAAHSRLLITPRASRTGHSVPNNGENRESALAFSAAC